MNRSTVPLNLPSGTMAGARVSAAIEFEFPAMLQPATSQSTSQIVADCVGRGPGYTSLSPIVNPSGRFVPACKRNCRSVLLTKESSMGGALCMTLIELMPLARDVQPA